MEFSLSSVPLIVRIISFSCLGVGFVLFAPFLFLIIFDFFLWIWRTCFTNRSARRHLHSRKRRTSALPTDSKAHIATSDEKRVNGPHNR